MKLKLSPQPIVHLELQSTTEEIGLLRKALGRFCTKDLVRAGLTDEEQTILRGFHSDLSEIAIAFNT